MATYHKCDICNKDMFDSGERVSVLNPITGDMIEKKGVCSECRSAIKSSRVKQADIAGYITFLQLRESAQNA